MVSRAACGVGVLTTLVTSNVFFSLLTLWSAFEFSGSGGA